MKLLWINDMYLTRSIAITSRLEIVRSLRRSGVYVTPVFWHDSDCGSRYIKHVDYYVFPCKVGKYYIKNRIKLLIAQCQFLQKKWEKYDVIIVEPRSALFFALYAFLSKLPISKKLVLDIRTVPVEITGIEGIVKDFIFNMSVKMALKYFAGITVISKQMKKYVSRTCPESNREIGIWSSGVNEKLFDPSKVKKDFKKHLGIDSNNVLFYHGSLSLHRGIQGLIKSVALIKRDIPDVFLVLLGEGKGVCEFRRLIKEYQLQKNIAIYPRVPYKNVPEWISIADIAVIPLPDYEWWNVSSPLKLMEYMAMGKVVLVSNIQAHRDILTDRKSFVFYFNPRNIESMAGKIIEVLRRPDLRKLGMGSRQYALEYFTWDKQAQKLITYLEGLKWK